jgi:hypothetical protein
MSKAQEAYKEELAKRNAAIAKVNTKVNDSEERESPEFWINVGTISDTGEFVSLPYGLGLDTMRFSEKENGDTTYMMEVKNSLLMAIREITQDMPAGSELLGEELELPLTVRIRRVGKSAPQVPLVRGRELLMSALKKRS